MLIIRENIHNKYLSILQALRQLDFPAPRLIQAYAWKCILRGMNFVGLSPPDSGKTLGYLIPIISQILNTGRYATLPKGPGVSICKFKMISKVVIV